MDEVLVENGPALPDSAPSASESREEERARRSVAVAIRIVGPPDVATARNLE